MSKFDVKVKKLRTAASQMDLSWLPQVMAHLRKIPPRGWLVLAIGVGVLAKGTPHILISYYCNGPCGPYTQQYDCAYFGVQGMVYNVQPEHQGQCDAIKLIPLNAGKR